MLAHRKTNWACFEWLIPVLIGVTIFFCVVGPRVLDPSNIAWLGQGDQATMYLGWLFFRHADWSLPPGLNPNYGLEFSNAIVYSDSIPLLALLFKPFSPWLPEVFQYFGLWILVCFVLQSWFAWKIMRLISPSTAICLLGTILLTFSPPMIWRLHPYIGHISLVGHFMILAAIYLVLRPTTQHRLLYWLLLLVVTALVHAYLLVMLLALWFADRYTRFFHHEISNRSTLLELVTVVLSVGLACWMAGYYSVSTHVSSSGYGASQMNLLAIFDPGRAEYGLWSSVIPDIPDDPTQHEGFNFLGLGLILLMPFALIALWQHFKKIRTLLRRYRPVCVVLILLFLFSLTNNLSVGDWTLRMPINDIALLAANVFRASGRMFWPVYYAIVITVIYLLVRGYGKKLSVLLLTVAVGVQLIDTRDGWLRIRSFTMMPAASAWQTGMVSPFWDQAAKHYAKVRRIPLMYNAKGFEPIPYYAGTHQLATDGVYLNRIDTDKLAAAEERARKTIQEGDYDADSLYIVDAEIFAKASKHADPHLTMLTQVDGFYVIAKKPAQ